MFELEPVNRKSDAPGYHLTDGRVTLSIMPWSIPVFENMSIKRPGPDHIGFHVEDLAAFKAHAASVGGMNPYLAGVPLGGSPESDVRRALLRPPRHRQIPDVRPRRQLDRHHRRIAAQFHTTPDCSPPPDGAKFPQP